MSNARLTIVNDDSTAHHLDLLGRLATTCLDLLALGALACDAPIALVGVPGQAGRAGRAGRSGEWSTLSYGSAVYRGLVADRLLETVMGTRGPCDLSHVLATSSGSSARNGNCVKWAYGGALADTGGRPVGAALVLDRRERAVTNREQEAVQAMTRQISAALSSARNLAAHPSVHGGTGQDRTPVVAERGFGSLDPYTGERTDLLRSGDVACLFHVTVRTVANWATSGRLPSVRTVGGHRRFPADGVASLLAGTAGHKRDPAEGDQVGQATSGASDQS